ncbi:MAG: hypothetical protein VXW14_07390, partial [Candidatus Thermoplasmatota archaeon]|nr:hypothetical protein [Candidatus Thermoplasmatota archaeon]
RIHVVDVLGESIINAIKRKHGGDSYKELVLLVDAVLGLTSLGFYLDEKFVEGDLKSVKSNLSKEGVAHFDLLSFRYSKAGKKLEIELKESKEPVDNPNLVKLVKLLRKAGFEELADEYEERKMTDVKTVQREIRNAVNLQTAISALKRGVKGIGDYSFLTLDDFRSLLEKI